MKQADNNAKAQWKGYTMDELMYHRVLTMARIEMTKERMSSDAQRIRSGSVFMSGSLLSRLLKVFDYTDYLVLGLTAWRRLSPLFRRRKK